MKGVKKLEKVGWMMKYHLIALRGDWSLNLSKMQKEKINLVIIFKFFFNFETLVVHVNPSLIVRVKKMKKTKKLKKKTIKEKKKKKEKIKG
jgi:hypothetical protein